MDAYIYAGPRPYREIRGIFTPDAIRVYQAFPNAIAQPALERQRFVAPFRFDGITTWIKPSFLWMMTRSNWGRWCRKNRGKEPEHEGDTTILAIMIERACFDRLLACARPTHREERPDLDTGGWKSWMRGADVLVQWDPEKDLAGSRRSFKAIQIGLKRHAIDDYNRSIVSIEDMSPMIAEIKASANLEEKVARMPLERPYPVAPEIGRSLHMAPPPPSQPPTL